MGHWYLGNSVLLDMNIKVYGNVLVRAARSEKCTLSEVKSISKLPRHTSKTLPTEMQNGDYKEVIFSLTNSLVDLALPFS